MLEIKSILNKNKIIVMIIGVTLSVVLLLNIGLFASSIHKYFTNLALKEKPYHVSINGPKINKTTFIKNIVEKEDTIYIKYKNVYNTYKNTKYICAKIQCSNIKYNDKLLSLYGINKNKNVLNTIKNILITVLTILGIGLFILITNAYRASLISRTKELGILKSLGMTKYQIIKMLLTEGTIILFISLLIGSLISVYTSMFVLTLLNNIFKDIFEIKLTLNIYPIFILISFIYIIIIFYISALLPVIAISKSSIIEIIRNNLKTKKLPKYTNKFKIFTKISFANYYRTKKQYKAITLSIFINVILYISFSLYLNYGISGIKKQIKLPNYDFYLSTRYDKDTYQKLNNLKYKHYIYKVCLKNNKTLIDRKDNLKIYKNKQIVDDITNYCDIYNINLYIKGNTKAIIKYINKLKLKELEYTDISKANKLTNNFLLGIKISLYSMLIIVILIGIMSIINTFSTTFNQRIKDIGILKSIGFTDNRLKKLLLKESLFILIKAYIYIIPVAILITYVLNMSINEIVKSKMIVPYQEFIISFVVSYFIIYFSLILNYNKINKKPIIEMINHI